MNYIEITDCAKYTEDNSWEKSFLKVSNPLPTSMTTCRKTGALQGLVAPGMQDAAAPGGGARKPTLPPPCRHPPHSSHLLTLTVQSSKVKTVRCEARRSAAPVTEGWPSCCWNIQPPAVEWMGEGTAWTEQPNREIQERAGVGRLPARLPDAPGWRQPLCLPARF